MKTIIYKAIASVTLLLTLSLSSLAQAYLTNPKYGPDEETRKECAINISLYGEYYGQGNYTDAKKHWQKVLTICPAASKNTYIRGAKMLKDWFEKETNPARKTELLDSLLLVYDMRIQYYNEKGSLLGQKGTDLYTFDPLRYEEAYGYLAESIDIDKDKSSSSTLYTFMVVTKEMYDNQKITADKVIETYSLLADHLDVQIASGGDEVVSQVKENIDALFSVMGVANCENLDAIFGSRVNANPTDVELAKKTFSLLKANKCSNLTLYRKTGAVVFENEPSAELAYDLAKIFNNLGEFKNAENYYKEAISMEADSVKKSVYLLEYAQIVGREFNNPEQSRSLALQAVKINPGLGHAYIHIGHLYAGEKNCGDDFAKKTVFWAAVDKFAKAKQVDPNLADDCNKLIETYSQYFPASNDIFFQDLKPGDTYTVGCWIGEQTVVRAKP
ncbi:MAG TPA: hypothetical protein PL017_02655 [Tenuifilaceae bacterium]|nr:hypothetical protein [Tenuifilaceae bacterium]HPE17626.1 hypothetical protein [Tenuifilaceae bacterium]HPJ44971.1 hypothetical protein [Tenuifilaceae bacterium]HPQ33782.1 hypothetical protein [Tenuifilaceae bacterium]HRX67674.1 hypothetical protein [Tenuifilaceae bacterium]